MVVLETVNKFEDSPDRKLREKLEAELPGIFNWALDGLERLNAQGEFTEPKSSRQLAAEMDEAASPITEFITETCELDEAGFVPRSILYSHWKMWCERNGYFSGSMRHFLAQIRAAYGRKIVESRPGGVGSQQRGFSGVALGDRVIGAENVIRLHSPASQRSKAP